MLLSLGLCSSLCDGSQIQGDALCLSLPPRLVLSIHGGPLGLRGDAGVDVADKVHGTLVGLRRRSSGTIPILLNPHTDAPLMLLPLCLWPGCLWSDGRRGRSLILHLDEAEPAGAAGQVNTRLALGMADACAYQGTLVPEV